MKSRNVLSFLLSLVMVFCIVPMPSHALEPDIAAPVLKTVSISANAVDAPGTIQVIVEAEDDISGIYTADVTFASGDRTETLYCTAESSYLDAESGKYVPYPDGKLHGTLHARTYTTPGEYTLVDVELEDYAGNFCTYSTDIHNTDQPNLHKLPESLRSLSFRVNTEGTPDRDVPQLKAVTLSQGEVNAPGTLKITVDTADDISGAVYASVSFFCQETDKYLLLNLEDPDSNGTFHGSLDIPAYTLPGTYRLRTVSLHDAAGNWASISIDPLFNDDLPPGLSEVGFTVRESESPDNTPPVLHGIKLTPDTFAAPCGVWVTIDASDDISGMKSASISFAIDGALYPIPCYLSTTFLDPETRQQVPYPDGKLHGVLELDAFTEAGTMRIKRISLCDNAGNMLDYCNTYDSELDPQDVLLPEELLHAVFNVTNSANGAALRIYGDTRYETAFQTAEYLKELWAVDQFNSIIVACGTNFPDALSGTYLAAVKRAPILLTKGAASFRDVNSYILDNLKPGGTVYILGDNTVVPDLIGADIPGITIRRLGGATRYDTNLLILQEAGIGEKDILVCTGENFADSLSASPLGLPILLVKGRLTQSQKGFLADVTGNIIILGGPNAVSTRVEGELAAYGNVRRVAGNTRYETSVRIAEEFFASPDVAVLCYARNFPDGLCAGPLAFSLDAPVILTDSVKPDEAIQYAASHNISNGYILGGNTLISDITAKKIFRVAAEIPVYTLQ